MKIADGFEGQRFIAIPNQMVEVMEQNAITRQLYVFLIGYFPRAEFHYIKRAEGCQEHVFIYCTDGGGQVNVDGEEYHLEKGQYIVIPKGHPHEYYSDKDNPWTIYWIHLRGCLADKLTSGMHQPCSIPSTGDSRKDERNMLFDEITQTLDTHTSVEAMEYASMLLMHYLATLRHIDIYRSTKPGQSNSSCTNP